jgi:F0F1-type ATP synthase membrane subunit b/b'
MAYKDPEKLKAHNKAYQEANKERLKACREANKEKHKAYNEAYREANKEKEKAYREANKEKHKAYREANKLTKADKITALNMLMLGHTLADVAAATGKPASKYRQLADFKDAE